MTQQRRSRRCRCSSDPRHPWEDRTPPEHDHDRQHIKWTGLEGALWNNDWLRDQRGPMVLTIAEPQPWQRPSRADMNQAFQEAEVGKKLPDSLYCHVSALDTLPSLLYGQLERAVAIVGGDPGAYDLVKFAKNGLTVSLLDYPTFMDDPHPALQHATTVNLETETVRKTDYSQRASPPILHRKEAFLDPGHPKVPEFRKLTKQEEAKGLLSQPGIGTRQRWEELLSEKGLAVEDHELRTAAAQKNKKPTRDMVDFFETRTREHIGRVIKFMKAFDGFADFGYDELLERAKLHDQDKYQDPELVLPYVWVTEFHRVNNEQGSVDDELQQQYDLANDATGQHVERNLHHPEAHESLADMTPLDLTEMVADWSAMAEELDQGSARSWADQNVGQKWKFSDDQRDFIFEAIDWLEKATKTKTANPKWWGAADEGFHVDPYQHVAVQDVLDEFDELLAIQCADGNWNVDPYMHGMANGMLLMRSIVSGEDPDFLEAPETWLNADAREYSAGHRDGYEHALDVVGVPIPARFR